MKKSLRSALMFYIVRTLSLVLLPLLIVTANSYAQKKVDKEFAGEEAAKKVRGAVYVKEKKETPFPALVRMSGSSKITIARFIPWLKQTVQSDAGMNFRLLKQENDELGFTHYRYQQTFLNIPVENTYYHVHVKNGYVSSFNGMAVNIAAKLAAKPSVTEAQALKTAIKKIDAKKYMWEDAAAEADLKKQAKNQAATHYPKGQLCWLSVGETYRLAYRFDIQSMSPFYFQRIYIDAQNGNFLLSVPLQSSCDAAPVNTIFNGNRTVFTDKLLLVNIWNLTDNCQASHIRVRDWNSSTCTSSSPQDILSTDNTWTTTNQQFGASVLWATKESYLYWKNVRGRNGYDNANGNVDAYINAVFDNNSTTTGCQPGTGNASMNNSGQMLIGIGNGTLTDSWATLDIIAHEFTHAVTSSSANLVYMNESGALNESFSDIFGEAAEFYTTGSNDWLIHSQQATTNGRGIRSMKDPTANPYNDPDTYLDPTYWKTGTADFGGVHSNSGVQNYWFYLLTTGGSGTNANGNSYDVSGIGLSKASAIAARNLLTYLGPNSNYSDARDNSIQAAVDLYGECSNEVKQVTNAWHAVGVGARYFYVDAIVTSNYNGRHVSCHDACNGSATVVVISGDSPTFSWSNGATSQSISGLCPGTYTVTVTNENGTGCSATSSVTINNTPELLVAPASVNNFNGYSLRCYGDANGSAATNASGGTAPYSYSWSNGQTSATATNLSAGTYSVTVTDANGCSKSGSVTITQPPPLTTTATATSNYNGYNVRCNGGADGTAAASPSGGVTPYSYSWSNGQNSQNASGLMATTYTVTVTDANGCTAPASITLTQPPPLTIDAGPNKIVYYGYPDSACTNLTYSGGGGGVPPYNIVWNTGSSNATINVCPQVTTVYTVTISDANGCSVSDNVTVCAIDVRCGNKLDKVTICHRTSGSNLFETLCLDINAAKNHFLLHPEDQLAACGTVKVCNDASLMVRAGNGVDPLLTSKPFIIAHPNPVSSVGMIKFMTSTQDRGTIKLYDVTGKEVASLFEGSMQANVVYNVSLNTNRYSKGVYLVRLFTRQGVNKTVKLVITR